MANVRQKLNLNELGIRANMTDLLSEVIHKLQTWIKASKNDEIIQKYSNFESALQLLRVTSEINNDSKYIEKLLNRVIMSNKSNGIGKYLIIIKLKKCLIMKN